MITYVPINLSNRHFYIGSTLNFDRRWGEHLKSTDNYPFQNALRNDPENFFVLVSEDDGLDTREEEQYYLDFYFGSEWCYNLSRDATAPFQGRNHSEETKKHLSTIMSGEQNSNFGNRWKWKWSSAQLSALEERPRGKDHHWSSDNRDTTGPNNSFYGRNHTEETKERNRLAHTGENNTCTGTKWWVNSKNETRRETQSPGDGWQPGRKWRN